MSVYKPKASPFWAYDFVIKGRRFHGSTGQQNKRAAEAFERRVRTAVANGEFADAGDMTLDAAADKWFEEIVRGSASEGDVERRLGDLIRDIGKARKLRDITAAVVSDAIAKRRGRLYRGHVVANGTVNRDVIAPLRAILRRARKVWGARNMPEIEWKELAMPERAGIVREFSAEEETAWQAACPGDMERLALRLLLRYGMRFSELWFSPADVDVTGRRLTLRNRKASEFPELTLPLLPDDALDLGRLASVALAEGRPDVWGLRYWQMYHRLRRAAAIAKVRPGRIIHGTRHHAGTQIARAANGNLAVAKKLLGHASITSTVRYAHAMEDDVRRALESVSRNSPGGPSAESPAPHARQRKT